MAAKPRTPELGEVHLASPKTSVDGDKHGSNPRRVGVVEVTATTAYLLGRTTHPDEGARTLASPKNPEIGLTEDGYWQDVHQRSLSHRQLADPELCRLLGVLPEPERSELLQWWRTSVMLGRRGL